MRTQLQFGVICVLAVVLLVACRSTQQELETKLEEYLVQQIHEKWGTGYIVVRVDKEDMRHCLPWGTIIRIWHYDYSQKQIVEVTDSDSTSFQKAHSWGKCSEARVTHFSIDKMTSNEATATARSPGSRGQWHCYDWQLARQSGQWTTVSFIGRGGVSFQCR